MISTYLRFVGRTSLGLIQTVGRCCLMFWHTVWGKPHPKLIPLIIRQIYQLGILSLPIILPSALFIGMVLAFQGYNVLVGYSAEESLGSMVSLSLLRELSPVVAALLFAGRAGSALTAEIGLMQTTEQLASMEMMAISPFKRVIAPRLFAGILVLPMLTVFFNLVGVWGGYLIGVSWMGIDGGTYWSVMQSSIEYLPDVGNGLIKSVVFAILITWIALYNGYYVVPNALGISKSTTQTVVVSSLLVLAMDFILTVFMFGI